MIHDLAIIMLVAGAISFVCKWLKQPVVLGYIVAGLLAGPYVAGSSWVDVESVETWGQVGVIFLLFTLGLDFSFKKLVSMGSTAFIGCITIVIGMMSVGFLLGRLLGWNEMNSLFLGGMICMSSTTIVYKALDDLGLRQQKFAGICFGILVVEDLFAVVLMVLLASLAVKQQFDGGEMVWQISKLAAYLLFWFVAGIMIIPTMLKKLHHFLNEETMTIVALGLCLGMVMLAESAGFSSALGAFVMGSILAETVEAERIEHLMSPIKNLFGAVFFVSVGMMINPATLAAYWFPISLITLLVIVGQLLFATIGVVLAGQPLKVAMQSAFALTQVGEFAFIIAQFGDSLGVTEKFLYPVIVAVSVITTFLTPYIIRLSAPAYLFVVRRMPKRLQLLLDKWATGRETVSQQSAMRQLLRKVGLVVVIYFIVILFILTFWFQFFSGYIVDGINSLLPEGMAWVGRLVGLVAILLILSPFLYKMVTKHLRAPEARALWSDGHFRRASLLGLGIARFLLGLGLIIFCISSYFNLTSGVLIGVAVIVSLSILFSKKIHKQSSRLEHNFMSNLSAREVEKDRKRVVKRELEAVFLDYDLHLADFCVTPESTFCGLPLSRLNLRKLAGVNVVRIVRGQRYINVPGGDELLCSQDIVIVAGTDTQIRLCKQLFDHASATGIQQTMQIDRHRAKVSLEQVVVRADHSFCGHTLAESNFRDMAQCLVLGIDHLGETILNPPATQMLCAGDVLILAGEKQCIEKL